MKAKVRVINGLFIIYDVDDGRWGIDDSTFYEVMNINKGDIIELTAERELDLRK